jgi:hypothetical protein
MDAPHWDIALTQQLLLRKPLNGHLVAMESFNSILDRLRHARYHYHCVARPWAEILERARSAEERWRILGWRDKDGGERFQREQEQVERSANLVACVQAMHAIPDTLAFLLFYCLISPTQPNRSERSINVKNVIKWLAYHDSGAPFGAILREITESPTYLRLDALSNHGKHRSIVSDTMAADVTGTDTVPLRLRFRAFSYDGAKYPSVDALPLLRDEFDRINPLIAKCGNLLNSYLSAQPDRPRSE